MLHQRHLICQRCGREQWAAGRVIEEAERELSYRWCVDCLDTYGPCAAPAQVGGEDLGIEGFFQGLAQHLRDEVAGQVMVKPFAVGDLVIYRGSLADHHGPSAVLEDLGPMVRIRTRKGEIECRWASLGKPAQWLLDAAAHYLAHSA